MDKIVPKPKTVNLEKLSALTDAELSERISKCAEKVAKKRDRFDSQNKLNQARLAAYESYRKADAEACKKLLSDRKTKAALPTGNSQAVGKTA